MVSEVFESPRKKKEIENKYWAERLEFWLNERDEGNMTHEEAMDALRAEKLASNVLERLVKSE